MISDPGSVIDLIDAFRRSKAMFAAVALGIFDRLENEPAEAAVLASELNANPDAVQRLLDACAGLGFLERAGRTYRNLPLASAYLRRASPQTLAGYILYSNSALFPMWAHLEDAVREGTPRWEQTFGAAGTLFDHFFRTDEAMRDFLMGMHGFGLLSSPAVVAAFDLSRFTRLADLGGATGHLALAACERYPHLRAVVFDLPRVLQFACAHERVDFVAGDFFTDPLPPADLYAAGRILHDWSEDKIRGLLAKIHAALPPGGGLLVAEKLLAEDRSGPVSAHMQSLNMLVCTEGKERTLSEYRVLLEEAGFAQVEGRRTGAPLDAVLALRPRL